MSENIVNHDVQALVDGWLESERNGEQFPVDFDIAWQIAGYSRKDNAKRSLKNFLHEGEDFRLLSVRKSNGGRGSEEFRLTCDAFKELCMLSRSEQGKATRLYFIDAEKKLKEAIAVQKPMSTIELMQYSVQMLAQHDQEIAHLKQQNVLLIEQNKMLCQQVALLNAQTEAIELETEANAVELSRYKNGHGRYYTVSAWCNLHGYEKSLQECNVLGRKASAMCRIRDIVPQPVKDPRFGTVNSYPDSVLEELDWH